MTEFTLIIRGHPIVLKNSKKIAMNKTTGKRMVIESKAAERYRQQSLPQLWQQWGARPAIAVPIALQVMTFGAWKVRDCNVPDASNLYQFPEDLLQAAGVIADDRQIEHHDGSRRICMCDVCKERPRFKSGPREGTRKENCGAVKRCPLERVELTITIL
jgi:Holliday junction resolvase RusA-like endonuclease